MHLDDDDDKLIEKLADLEHQQWLEWSKTVYERYGHDDCEQCWLLKKHWEKNWIPYAELPETMKEFDRRYARKVLELIERYTNVKK